MFDKTVRRFTKEETKRPRRSCSAKKQCLGAPIQINMQPNRTILVIIPYWNYGVQLYCPLATLFFEDFHAAVSAFFHMIDTPQVAAHVVLGMNDDT